MHLILANLPIPFTKQKGREQLARRMASVLRMEINCFLIFRFRFPYHETDVVAKHTKNGKRNLLRKQIKIVLGMLTLWLVIAARTVVPSAGKVNERRRFICVTKTWLNFNSRTLDEIILQSAKRLDLILACFCVCLSWYRIYLIGRELLQHDSRPAYMTGKQKRQKKYEREGGDGKSDGNSIGRICEWRHSLYMKAKKNQCQSSSSPN